MDRERSYREMKFRVENVGRPALDMGLALPWRLLGEIRLV